METENKRNKPIRVFLKDLKITPRKVRLVTKAVVSLAISDALNYLENSPKRAALPILKLLNSVIANAVNNYQLNLNNLAIDNILVNEGSKLKRYQPRAKGATYPICKRFSHVEIILKQVNDQEKAINTQESAKTKNLAEKQKKIKEVVKKNGTKN